MSVHSPAYLVLISVPSATLLSSPGASNVRVPAPGHAFALAQGNNIIGRADPSVAICLPWLHISRKHAQVESDGQSSWDLSDLLSRNGTRLNGQALQPNMPMPLCEGDRILIADIELVFTFQPALDCHMQDANGDSPHLPSDTTRAG